VNATGGNYTIYYHTYDINNKLIGPAQTVWTSTDDPGQPKVMPLASKGFMIFFYHGADTN
jgi:hypothetical protein